MGQENETIEAELSEKGTLIDFLYVDNERIDSLISQLRNGTLRSVIKTVGTSEGSSMSGKLSMGVANGTYSDSNKSDSQAAENYDPYHSKILNLLHDLNLDILSVLPAGCAGQLVLINKSISIRDIASMRSLIPVVESNQAAFGIKFDKATRGMFKLMNQMLKSMSDSIALSIYFDDELINGTLKESGLSIKQDDLMRTYGSDLPDDWFILGILDDSSCNTPKNVAVDSVESAIDVYASAMNELYSKSKYKIIPILIFREINY